MFENIERIGCPSREEFLSEYVAKKKPVIIQGLFTGQPIEQIDSLAKARAHLGDMPVVMTGDYEQYLIEVLGTWLGGGSGRQMGEEKSTVAGYLDIIESDPSTRKICSEVPQAVIGKLVQTFEVPAICRDASGDAEGCLRELWFGNTGYITHLHYDYDQRHVVQYQLFGTKHIILVPPKSGKKLVPARNQALISPAALPEEERDAFVRYVDGYQCVLRPGEAIYMPALIWHHLEYLEPSMAVTMRFQRNQYNSFLVQNGHVDFHMQALAWDLLDESAIDDAHLEAFREIEAAATLPYASQAEKIERLQEVYERIYARLYSNGNGSYARPFVNVLTGAIRQWLYATDVPV